MAAGEVAGGGFGSPSLPVQQDGWEGWGFAADPDEAGQGSGLFNGPGFYIVSTPIGNLGDITLRALEVLSQADVLYAEDTRSLSKLLGLLKIPLGGRLLESSHKFNEKLMASKVVDQLRAGRSVALVSDAGTPAISDPGSLVVQRVRDELGADFPIRSVPGACAAVAALSVAGVPAQRFLFVGFLSSGSRDLKILELRKALQQATAGVPTELVLYEAPHKILHTLEQLALLLEDEALESSVQRRVIVCRELTKRFETVLKGTAREVLARLEADPVQRKGEFVVIVEGATQPGGTQNAKAVEVMQLLSAELPRGKAAHLAAKICGGSKKELLKL